MRWDEPGLRVRLVLRYRRLWPWAGPRAIMAGMSPLAPELFEAGDRILVAVSGGADSLTLLHALCRVRQAWGVDLTAAHVHHGMRGPIAEEDVRFLEELCAEWAVPLVVERWDVPGLARDRRVSVEEAGRFARYTSFGKLARERRCNKVATAHTADDQAETILLNLFRGAGIDGLRGIPPRRPLSQETGAPEVVRPLLHVWRAEIDRYVRAHGLEPREDSTNRDLRYRRSRIRYDLLPLLGKYDPAVKQHLVRLSLQAREEAELLTDEARALLERATESPPSRFLPFRPPTVYEPALALSAGVLNASRPALARRALREALRVVGGGKVEIDAALVERMMEMLRESGPRAVDLPGGTVSAVSREGRLEFHVRERFPAAPLPVELPVQGEVELPTFGLRLMLERCAPPSDPRTDPDRVYLNADALRPPLVLRAPAKGDRFRPLGAPGSRLLSDVLADRKTPGALRPVWPVVADTEGTVWVVGIIPAERARVGEGTRGCLLVTAIPL